MPFRINDRQAILLDRENFCNGLCRGVSQHIESKSPIQVLIAVPKRLPKQKL
jgi:hypothetical protein